ncbi:DinB family protein [Ramlibacter sp. USB13]|uniref:DinB family protein n=1 Tax=Ramlibacter cellulosilyticus TaxID=2764187 RepID=A0A923ML36_9BURK|nr:DinB family protein [Ramlibacter cellulosilyticus]MBC5781505.1 DinB family protein [Ramlibacter cellulosilyticus]
MEAPTPPDASQHPVRGCLERQFAVAWQLTGYHLEGLTTAECLWRPAARGLHVHRDAQGHWQADWPTTEDYTLGPSSIGWLTWHLGFWWSMALDHNFGGGTLTREAIAWPGEADQVRAWISGLQQRWAAALHDTTDEELASPVRVRWPFQQRPLADLFAWANTELAKNAAEIGYARFLHAASAPAGE